MAQRPTRASLDLSRPLAWRQASPTERALLQDLQANILKGHGRRHVLQLLLHFDAADPARRWLHELAGQLTSAWRQLHDGERWRRGGPSGGPVLLLALSQAGYQALGTPASKHPKDAAFRAGMAARGPLLADPAPATWELHWRGPVHALLVAADGTGAALRSLGRRLKAGLPAGVRCLGEERGQAIASRRCPGEGVEHFGFVNGRSQPLMLVEDLERERDERDGCSVWDPGFGPELVLVPDPAGRGPASHGSYLVLRKLEQNVRAFHAAEAALAQRLALEGGAAERAGALLVGRFRDGTPLVLQHGPGAHHPVPNNFDYLDDPQGRKCPFQAHIRKTNPRGGTGALGATIEQERAHLVVRRGIPYGRRRRPPDAPGQRLEDLPDTGVGLLFMAYQADIARQFEFMQSRWANDPGFPRAVPPTGPDPLIGQGPGRGHQWPVAWGGRSGAHRAAGLRGFVTLQGGEYFFAPSISGLRRL